LAEKMLDQSEDELALDYLRLAQSADYACVRASLIKARFHANANSYKEALRCYKDAIAQDPAYLSEIVPSLVRCYQELNDEAGMLQFLAEYLARFPRFPLVRATANNLQQKKGDMAAIEFLADQMQHEPSMRGLSLLVELYVKNSAGDSRDKLLILQNFMHRLLADKPIYRCEHCGYSGKTLFWLCPSCHHWNTVKPIQGLEGN